MTPYSFPLFPKEIQYLASDRQMTLSKDIFDFDLQRMLKAACKITNANYDEAITKSRKIECVEAKRLLCYFLRTYTKLTCKKIGDILGMHHATVLHHSAKFKDLIEVNDPTIFQYLSRFKKANLHLITKYRRK